MKTLKVQNANKKKMTFFIILLTLIFWILGSMHAFADDLEYQVTIYPDPVYSWFYYWGLDEEGQQTSLPNYKNFRFGESIAAGDINGDGIDDIIVYNGKEGTVYVYDVYAGIGQNYVNPELLIKIDDYISAVALADVNGDDIMDIIIGSDHYSSCYAFYGSTAWLNPSTQLNFNLFNSNDPDWSVHADSVNSDGVRFGYAVSSAGDINGDGIEDIIVGAPGESDGKGKAYIIYGSPEGLPTEFKRFFNYLDLPSSWEMPPGEPGEAVYRLQEFGSIIARGSHITNRQGTVLDNVIIGIPEADWDDDGDGYYEETNKGVTFFGPPWGIISGPHSRFGYALGYAGDVNGDSHPDILICSSLKEIFLYLGRPRGFRTTGGFITHDWSVTGIPYIQYYPGGVMAEPTVGSAGDINSDGYGDIYIGDKNYWNEDPNEEERGRLYIWYGGSPSTRDPSGLGQNQTPETADIILDASNLPDFQKNFGSQAASGDLNGDGVSDLVVGDINAYHPNSSNPSTGECVQSGAIHIFFSTADPPPDYPSMFGEHYELVPNDEPQHLNCILHPELCWPVLIERSMEEVREPNFPPIFSQKPISNKRQKYLASLFQIVEKRLDTYKKEELSKDDMKLFKKCLKKLPKGNLSGKADKSQFMQLMGKKDYHRNDFNEIFQYLNAAHLQWAYGSFKQTTRKIDPQNQAQFGDFVKVKFDKKANMPKKLTLQVENWIPKMKRDFTSPWPAVTFAFKPSRPITELNDIEIQCNVSGLMFLNQPLSPKILEWDGKNYVDITQNYDPKTQIIIGNTRKLKKYVILNK